MPLLNLTGHSYAIIGTREPDGPQLALAEYVANYITTQGGIVRTGGAVGIDHRATVYSKPGYLQVFLPWASYNRNIIPIWAHLTVYDPRIHQTWTESVRKYHPAYYRLTRGAIALHARNYGIIEGCRAVFAFPDENGGGGTGQGIRLAKALNIPLAEFRRGASLEELTKFVVSDQLSLLLDSK